jgi:hypothetical protein
MASRGVALIDATTGSLILEQSNGPFLAATITGINLKSTGATTVWTVPSIGGSAAFWPTCMLLYCTASTSVTVVPTVRAGVSTSLTSLAAARSLTGFNSVGQYVDLMEGTGTTPAVKSGCPQGSIIQISVTVGATATTMDGGVSLFGYFIG